MVRKLSLAIALALGVTPFAAYSLGLGIIKSKSGLNQRFQADIELLSVKNEEIGDIKATLASEEVFAKAGVDRPFFLSQLKFKPVRLANGGGIIRVTSREPVREPFLNFLIELNWPKGRLYREYTVLLDPPATLRRKPAPVQAARTTGKAKATEKVSSGQVDQGAGFSSSGYDEYGPTRRNDTLWKIASRVRHSGTTLEQMMMAMFQANPQAFIKYNINNLKVGEILRVPEREAVLALTASEAHAAFRDQVENWRAGRAAPPVMAPPAAAEPVKQITRSDKVDEVASGSDDAATPEAELKIARMRTAEDAEKRVADSADQTDGSGSLKEDLLDAREMRESALEESKELKNRVESLASQLEDLQRLLELKDEQLARLQVALGEKPDSSAAQEETAIAESTPLTSEMEEELSIATDDAAEGTPAVELENVDDETLEIEIPEFESSAEEEAPVVGPGAAEKLAVTPDSTDTETPAKPVPAPAEIVEKAQSKPAPEMKSEPKQEAGFLEQLTNHPLLKKITSDPTMMAIGGAVVAVLLALLWLLTGRRKKDHQAFQESILVDKLDDEEASAVIGKTGSAEPESGNTEETSFLTDFTPSDIDALPEETGDVDPLAEADVYIAYGRFGQAEELVRQGLERNPRNQELKLKLFDILYAIKNAAAFTALAEEAKADGLAEANPGAWESVAIMGAKLEPGNSLFAVPVAAVEKPGGTSEEDLDELGDLDLGDLAASLDFDGEVKKGADQANEGLAALDQVAQQAESQESPDDGGLNLDLPEVQGDDAGNLDNLGEELESLDSTLDFDLDTQEGSGLDLKGLAQEMVAEPELENTVLDIPSLDLDNDVDAVNESAKAADEFETLSLETEEVERLELPDVEELTEASLVDLAVDNHHESDEISTKLELATAYLDMGDKEGARSILQEVINEGSEEQKQSAQKIIDGFS